MLVRSSAPKGARQRSSSQRCAECILDTGPLRAACEGGPPVFRVENADFIADKLASELLPNQEYREVLRNALEALLIQRGPC